MIVPQSRRGAVLPVERGDAVASIDGEPLGRVGLIYDSEFQVVAPAGDFWLSRDDVFLADEQGIVLAYGVEELPQHCLYHAGEVA
jgi:hypothetical protein